MQPIVIDVLHIHSGAFENVDLFSRATTNGSIVLLPPSKKPEEKAVTKLRKKSGYLVVPQLPDALAARVQPFLDSCPATG
jgi:hypothetical protein